MEEKEQEDFECFLKGEFLAEAEDITEKLEVVLTKLSEDVDNHVLIEDAIRYVHTLNGGAITVGFKQFSSFAHVFEQSLVDISEGSLKLDQKMTNHLLLASDFFFKLVDALLNSIRKCKNNLAVQNSKQICA
ncbi:MAG: Hpt domain-containing protein [Oligoflexales bacterium]